MKKLVLILIVVLAFISCGDGAGSGPSIPEPAVGLYNKAPPILPTDTPIPLPGTDPFIIEASNYFNFSPDIYTLVIDNDITTDGYEFEIKTGLDLTIIGVGGERTISLHPTTGYGWILCVEGKLTLGKNITVKGHDHNEDCAVAISVSGTFVMEEGSKITGNVMDLVAYPSYYGGGVYNDGTFIMNGGEISGNTGANGGGVYVNNGTFTMSGGRIQGSAAGDGFAANTATTGAALYVINSAAKYGNNSVIRIGSDDGTDDSNFSTDRTLTGKK